MEKIEAILWDFLRGVRQGSFRDDAILVKGCKNKVEKVLTALTQQSRLPQTTESIEKINDEVSALLGAKEQASTKGELTTPQGGAKTMSSPPPLLTPTPITTAVTGKSSKEDTSDQQGERDTTSEIKSVPSISEFAPVRKQNQSGSGYPPSPPTRGEFFIWFPFEEFGDLSVSDGILRFFLEASRPAGNPLACNLTCLQVAQWYVHHLSLDAFSRYTPKGHTRGVKAFWANLGRWNKTGLEQLEEAATWCRRVGTANKVAHARKDKEIREKLDEKRESVPAGDEIVWEEF